MPKCPKIAILGPIEYVNFDIPYVHIRTYIFKKLNRYVNQLSLFICVENPVCFLVCYVCKNNEMGAYEPGLLPLLAISVFTRR